MSLSNGALPTEKIVNDLTAVEKGQAAVNAFTIETNNWLLLARTVYSTFSTLRKSVKLKIEDKVVQLTAEKNIFGRIVIMSQQRNIEMKEIFCYPLGPIPWALANSMGTLKKTNKAILMPKLEKNAESSEEVLSHSCTIIDGIALVRKIKTAGLTYEQFSVKLLNAVMSSGCSSNRVDAVFDV